MQFRIYSIPVMGDPSSEAELNAFLRTHRVISVRRELVQPEGAAFWSFCVEYLDGHSVAVRSADSKASDTRQRVDYQQVLPPMQFALFLQLRELRKSVAASDGVPVYAICTNEQLAAMAKSRPATLTDLKSIEGIGDAKVEKYGLAFLELISKATMNPINEK